MKLTRFASRAILILIFTLSVCATTVQLFGQAGTWVAKAPIPTPRLAAAAASVNGIIYVIGGDVSWFGCGFTGVNEAYNPATDTWTTMAPMPTARAAYAAAVVNGIIYVVGGSEGCFPPSRVVEAYDPATNTWSTKAQFPDTGFGLGVTESAVGVINGMLYVAGGGNGFNAVFANLYVYDPVSDAWSAKTSMPTVRFTEAGAVANGAFYAVGGLDNIGIATSTFAYDPSTDTWFTKAPLSDPRNGLAASVVGNIIYTMGGVDASGPVPVATVESYDPATNAWTTLPSMPTGLYAPAAAEVNGTVYVMGGLLSQSSGAISAANEAFTPVCSYQIISTDNAGNFGFTAPLLNPGSGSLPNINVASVHQTIPLQVTVTDCHGNPATNLQVTPLGTVGLTAANSNLCTVDNPDNSISTASAGNLGWQNLGGGMYQYNWKPIPPKGACLSFSLNFGDGLQHIAYFQFK